MTRGVGGQSIVASSAPVVVKVMTDDVSFQSGTFRRLSRVSSRALVRRRARNRSLSPSYCEHDANTVAGGPAGSISIAAVADVSVLIQQFSTPAQKLYTIQGVVHSVDSGRPNRTMLFWQM